MKVREIIEFQIRDLGVAGLEPRYILMTPRSLDVLMQELGTTAGLVKMDNMVLSGEITFMNLPIILDPERSRFLPISVVGAARAELDVYMLKESRRNEQAPRPHPG